MTHALLAGILAAAVSAQGEAPVPAPVIHHEPLRCAVEGAFPRVEARVDPSGRIARALVKFRRVDSEYWYTVAMSAEGDRFVAALPAPKLELGSFRYMVDVVDDSALDSHTEEFEVTVVADKGACPVSAAASVASIVVEIPPYAPARPPVPDGFSASRVKGKGGRAVGMFYLPPKVAAAIGVTAVAGGAAAAAVALYDDNQVNQVDRDLMILRSDPPPGSVLSVSRDRLTLSVALTLGRDFGSGTADLRLLRDGSLDTCVRIVINHGPIAAGARELTFTGRPTSFCPLPAEINRGFLTISESFERPGKTVEFAFPINYSLVP